MRNKVKRNNMRRLTAVLLMLLMITGSFSIAASAQEVPETEAGKTAEAAPAESAPTDEAQTPAADAVQTQAGSSQTESSTPEETQPAEETVQTTEGVQEEASQPAEAGDETVSAVDNAAAVQPQAVSLQANNAPADSGSVNAAGQNYLVIDGSKRPDGISLAFKVETNGTTTEYVYDGSTIIDMTNGVDVTDTGIAVSDGSTLTFQQVLGLTKDYQQGNSPAGESTKQLKLILKDKDGKELKRISLNNSSSLTTTGYSISNAVTAIIDIANRIQIVKNDDYYHSGSCIIDNQTDNSSEFSRIFAMAGDKIVIDYSLGDYDHVDVSITDGSGKSVAFSGGKFTMPSSMAKLKMVYYYKAKNVNIRNIKPERGTLSVKKSQYRPGDKVVVNVKANSGYRFHTKTLAYIYMKDGKWTAQKITRDEDGKYSFIMPFCDIEIIGNFVEKGSSAVSSDPDSYIEYTDYVDEDEEAEAAEEPTEEEVQEMLDVTPLVSRIVAETVLTATVSVSSMTH